MDNRRWLQERALAQHGWLTRADLDEGTISRATRRGLVKDGTIEQVGVRTFRLVGSPTTPAHKVMRACLDVGGVASHRTAAWLHGLGGFAWSDPPEVTTTRDTYNYRAELLVLHTTRWLSSDDVVNVGPIPTFSVARTLFSLASLAQVPPAVAETYGWPTRRRRNPGRFGTSLSFERVKGVVDDALASAKATDVWLWWFLERARKRGRPGVRVLEAVLRQRENGDVTESWLERETLAILDRAGVPLPACQQRIDRDGAFAGRVDFCYLELKLIIEVSGHAWHSTREQRNADAARRRQLTLAGYQILEFTYEDVVSRPDVVVAEVLAARFQTAAA